MKRKLLAFAILFTGLSASFAINASAAYVDPTTTTFLFQALAGVVAVVGTAIVIWWRRAKRKVAKVLGIDENKNMEVEDEFTVTDENGEEAVEGEESSEGEESGEDDESETEDEEKTVEE